MNSSTQPQTTTNLETELNTGFIINLQTDEKNLKPTFDQILIESLDLAFSATDKADKQAIYHHLEKQYTLSKQGDPGNIKKFSQAIEDLFGEAALILEIKILTILHHKVPSFRHYPQKETPLSFTAYLENLRNYM